jgi:hypothetical protein
LIDQTLQLGDIDIDTPDRNKLLNMLVHVPARVTVRGKSTKHNTGVYFHQVPQDPFTKWCSLPYDQAEQIGCYKIDLLNNHVYAGVKDTVHLQQLMQTPPMWQLLEHEEFVQNLVHINQHVDLVKKLKPQSVHQLAIVLALIRPGKRHLVSKCSQQGWQSVEPEIWQTTADAYSFKKSHAISLAWTIVVQINLLVEQLNDMC